MCANKNAPFLLPKKSSNIPLRLIGLLTSIAFIASANAASYRLTNLSAVLPANTAGNLTLNNAGDIMGHASDPQSPAPNRYTYIYKNGAVTRLSSPPSSYAEAISFNDHGDMTGNLYQYAQDGVTVTVRHIFLYKDGQLTDITNKLPASQSGANIQAINNVGQLLGYFSGHDVNSYIYDSSSQQVTNIPALNNLTTGRAINNNGQVTGQAFTGFGKNHAFLFSNGKTSDLGSLGPGTSQDVSDGVSINDATQITGTSFVGGIKHGFLYQNGAMQDIGSLGGASTAFNINNAGVIVGSSQVSGSSDPHAFVYTTSTGIADLNTLIDPADPLASSVVLTSATDINDSGQILASGKLAWGQSASFLLTPVQATVDTAYYNFEETTHNWYNDGNDIAWVESSTAQKFAGESSLAVHFHGAGYVSIGVMYPPLLAGKTVAFHIYIPADANFDWVQPFVLEDYPGWTWHGNWQPLSNLQSGAWNTLTVNIPADAQPAYRLGVEFYTSQPYAGTAFIDSVGF